MSDTQTDRQDGSGCDPLIEEVRRIRGEICQEYGNDVDRLCDHLNEVAKDYDARRGIFAVVSREAADRVVASWGTDALRTDDPIVDEVRAIRRKLAEESKETTS